MSRPPTTIWKRRAVLAGGLLLAAAWTKGVPYLFSGRSPDLEFRSLPDLPPFRELVTAGTVSAGNPLLVGLASATPTTPETLALRQRVRDDPCLALYGRPPPHPVPIAVFSDFRCPNCRVMDTRLSEIEADDPEAIHIVRHELPVFGEASITAGRAALAADLQGAYRQMYERLIRTPAVTDRSYILNMAEQIGIDSERLLVDMQSDEVTARLQLSRAAADVFNFVGTPAFAIGRTVFMGAVPTSLLRSVIAMEKAGPCAAPVVMKNND